MPSAKNCVSSFFSSFPSSIITYQRNPNVTFGSAGRTGTQKLQQTNAPVSSTELVIDDAFQPSTVLSLPSTPPGARGKLENYRETKTEEPSVIFHSLSLVCIDNKSSACSPLLSVQFHSQAPWSSRLFIRMGCPASESALDHPNASNFYFHRREKGKLSQ